MMRTFLLWLSEQQGVFNFLRRNGLARRFAARFVAGETSESATAAALQLKSLGITTSLDLLGESVTKEAEAVAARDEYLRMLDGLAASGAEVNVSVKLTQMGLDIDEALCADNMRRILGRARELDGFVRLDMEGSAYTQRTLDFFERHLVAEFARHTGVVIQSCLRRSAADVEHLVGLGARVRLCKGAYLEAPEVAFPDKRDVDKSYVALMELLLRRGNYPALATHDPHMIEHAKSFVTREGIPAGRFEFQMLYGVRRDMQERLRKEGFNMRVYVPFGTQWYPYLMRRLAERPANIVFILGNVVRETLALRA
jgi:proline dehydrogenase